MIPIVKPYLPPLEKYQRYLEGVYQRNWLTNKGPLLQELEGRLADYLGVEHLMLVANGTLALQVAYRALGLEQGKVITTPFTFAATPGSLCWQNLKPKFADIDAQSLNLDVSKLANDCLNDASAIAPVHVFGNPCEVEQIQRVATAHNLKVIYDAAHAFGSQYKGQSVLRHGDATTLSLHATKLFHCVEGGAIIFKDQGVLAKARQLINFGFDSANNPEFVGINAKMSEIHAAMGLAMLDDIDSIIDARQSVVARYQQQLNGVVGFQQWHTEGQVNGAYAPILFATEQQLLQASSVLLENQVQHRRYFYPCLSESDIYGKPVSTPVASDVSRRVLCLPLYYGLELSDVDKICALIKRSLR